MKINQNLSTNPSNKSDNIKERLNLHLKRRQQETETKKNVNSSAKHKKNKNKRNSSADRNGSLREQIGAHNDGVDNNNCDVVDIEIESTSGEKVEKKSTNGDILTMIWNEKKNSLMRDPEVVQFIDYLMKIN